MNKRVLSVLLVLTMVLALATPVLATNDWEGEIDVVAVAVVNGKTYPTVQAAVDAANGGVVMLLTDADEQITATDLILDLNGYSLKKATVTGTLYGMDSATDGYVASDAKIETVEGTYAAHYRNADAKRYLAIAEEDGVSFHRFYMGITKVSLAPAVTGFGYKAEFYGDDAVKAQIASIGYNLWLTEDLVVTRTAAFQNLLTLRLKNVNVENYGEAGVNASVFVTLKDGTVITGATYTNNLRQTVEQVNEAFAQYTAAQKLAVKAMCEKYETIKSVWSVANILAWTE
ncbi:MAG: hypothetical protein IKW10_05015 [Oscillospiraceae bacterium]|nr:hypothetical protein [Oscillospiraceae bacterium]